jgi:hypothetical protein
VQKLSFSCGYSITLPEPYFVTRHSGPDYWIYTFSFSEGQEPFLYLYAGYGPFFPLELPEGKCKLSDIPPFDQPPFSDGHACPDLDLSERVVGELVWIFGSMGDTDNRCGEYLVRTDSKDEVITTNALHFWYFDIPDDIERK